MTWFMASGREIEWSLMSLCLLCKTEDMKKSNKDTSIERLLFGDSDDHSSSPHRVGSEGGVGGA